MQIGLLHQRERKMMMPPLVLPAILLSLHTLEAAKTFGISLKGQGFYAGKETNIFTRACAPSEEPCTMQHYWSGGFIPEYGSSLLRYYIDGEPNASVVLPLGLGHGQAAAMDDNAPWSAGSIMGKSGVGYTGWGTGHWDAEHARADAHAGQLSLGDEPYGPGGSGLFNSYLVPFGKNVTITIEMAGTPGHLVIFWIVLRGRTQAVLTMPGTPSVARSRASCIYIVGEAPRTSQKH